MDNLKKAAYEIRMTEQEKSAMRARIFGVPSPVPSSYFSYSFQFLHTRVLVPLSVVLVVLVGGSTTAAAQGALPGDFLYPVKISINEAVEAALATTPVAKAEVAAKLAERRVEEAEALAATGKLTTEVGEELAATFEQHAEDAEAHAEAVATEDPTAAATLRTKLGSSLLAHGEILATLTVGGSQENQEGAGVVAAKVLARTHASARPAYAPASVAMRAAKTAPAAESQTMTMSLMAADDIATTGDAGGGSAAVSLESDMAAHVEQGNEDDALRAQARATEALEAARARFDDNKDKYAGSAITQVSGEFAAIGELMELGSTTLETGHYTEAENDYTQALERITKLTVLLRVQARLQQNIITPILERNIDIEPSLEIPAL